MTWSSQDLTLLRPTMTMTHGPWPTNYIQLPLPNHFFPAAGPGLAPQHFRQQLGRLQLRLGHGLGGLGSGWISGGCLVEMCKKRCGKSWGNNRVMLICFVFDICLISGIWFMFDILLICGRYWCCCANCVYDFIPGKYSSHLLEMVTFRPAPLDS